jgi:hypothetical protein
MTVDMPRRGDAVTNFGAKKVCHASLRQTLTKIKSASSLFGFTFPCRSGRMNKLLRLIRGGYKLIAIRAPIMETRTLQELRALAKKLGLTGYSKLRKKELLRRLTAAQATPRPSPVRAAAKTSASGGKVKTQARKATASTTSPKSVTKKSGVQKEAVTPVPRTASAADAEQHVESAKYEFAPPNVALREPVYAAGFEDDIEHLPAIAAPLLCLLPQKPGVLLGYWVLPPGRSLPDQSLKLRLAHLAGAGVGVLDEVSLPGPHGYWYFHVADDLNVGHIYLQLGYYTPDYRFVSAIERGIARVPSLYASSHTDRRWWVSEDTFRAMYQRAGGFVRDTRLGWAGSASSLGGPPGERAQHLVWPGNVSSR